MVVIRLQRTGRKGHAMYRVVVQDARYSPTSGKVAAYLGHFDPHAKNFVFDKEKTSHYIDHGAQPSPRVARLLIKSGFKLPEWVNLPPQKTRLIKNTDKLRRNRTDESAPETPDVDIADESQPTDQETKTTDTTAEPKQDNDNGSEPVSASDKTPNDSEDNSSPAPNDDQPSAKKANDGDKKNAQKLEKDK